MSLPGLKLTMPLILFTNKNEIVAHEVQPGVTDILTTFDVICDLFLKRPTAIWNLFDLLIKKQNLSLVTSSMHLSSNRSQARTIQNARKI